MPLSFRLEHQRKYTLQYQAINKVSGVKVTYRLQHNIVKCTANVSVPTCLGLPPPPAPSSCPSTPSSASPSSREESPLALPPSSPRPPPPRGRDGDRASRGVTEREGVARPLGAMGSSRGVKAPPPPPRPLPLGCWS